MTRRSARFATMVAIKLMLCGDAVFICVRLVVS